MFFLLLFHYFVVFGIKVQGTEGSSAVLIELAEVLQALQTQVMDVAAQQVQREVQCVARKGDNQEDDDVARDGPQGVEHLGDDRAGQHQSHKTGVGQDVAKVARHMVV